MLNEKHRAEFHASGVSDEMIERAGLERVGSEDTDHGLPRDERTPEAGVNVARCVRVHEQEAIVRIRERAVGRKPNWSASRHDEIEPRVFAASESPAQHLRRQPVRRERDQLIPGQRQDGGRVARERPANGLEEAIEPPVRREGGRQIERDGEQRIRISHVIGVITPVMIMATFGCCKNHNPTH